MSLANRLVSNAANPLPLVIAGPMLRKVTKSSVTVWLALKQFAHVTLTLYSADEVGVELFAGRRETVRIGKNLHMVAVTARPAAGQANLAPRWVYSYDLSFDLGGGHPLDLLTAVGASGKDAYAYPNRRLPCFALPPDDLEQVRLIQGSCRKPNAAGPDALAILDDLIAASVDSPSSRPHQLLLTGDQIYADEVADILLLMLTDAADVLMVDAEPLPGQNDSAFLANMAPPTTRSDIIKGQAKLTTDDTRSHLMSFGEYVAMYLFVWSDVLWPKALPGFSDLAALPRIAGKQDALVRLHSLAGEILTQSQGVQQLQATLLKVRRALANVPTAMILDDHEITDDWNLNQGFCNGVYGNPLGLRVIQNGLAAYAVCQHWGNAPEQFEPSSALSGGTPAGATLLGLLDAKPYGQVADDVPIKTILGVHTKDRLAAQSGGYAVFHDVGTRAQTAEGWVDSQSLLYHYSLEATAYQVIITDTRTWRGFPRGGETSPPDLIAEAQLAVQIGQTPSLDNRQLLVVVTTNMPPAPTIRQGARDLPTLVKLVGAELWYEDFYDSWQIERIDFARALVEIARKFPARKGGVVLLSGDVHASSASRIAYTANAQVGDPAGAPTKAELTLVQLIGSALHNQSAKTLGQHNGGYAYVPPVYKVGIDAANALTQPIMLTEGFVGWNPTTTAQLSKIGVIDWDDHFMVGKRDLLFYADYCTHTLRDQTLPKLWTEKLLSITRTPDYRLRLDYLKVTDAGGYHKEPPRLEPSSDPLKELSDRTHAYEEYVRGTRRGSEIVGMNNIGEIIFVRHPDSFVLPKLMVRYTVHWHDRDQEFVFYDVSLDVGDKNFSQLPIPP